MSHTENGNQKIMNTEANKTAERREHRIREFSLSLAKSTFGTPIHMHFGGGHEWLVKFANETATTFIDSFERECARREAAIVASFENQEH